MNETSIFYVISSQKVRTLHGLKQNFWEYIPFNIERVEKFERIGVVYKAWIGQLNGEVALVVTEH